MQSANDLESASRNLNRLLGEWKKLTEAEKESMALEDWSELDDLQARKAGLQRLIQEAEHSLFDDEFLCAEEKGAFKRHFRQLAAELLQLEEANREFLAQKVAAADRQHKLFEKTIRSLRHVQRAYGVGSRSFWQAYS